MLGRRKARVLPLPVRAAPRTSRPSSRGGTVRAWTSVIFEKPISERAAIVCCERLSEANEVSAGMPLASDDEAVGGMAEVEVEGSGSSSAGGAEDEAEVEATGAAADGGRSVCVSSSFDDGSASSASCSAVARASSAFLSEAAALAFLSALADGLAAAVEVEATSLSATATLSGVAPSVALPVLLGRLRLRLLLSTWPAGGLAIGASAI